MHAKVSLVQVVGGGVEAACSAVHRLLEPLRSCHAVADEGARLRDGRDARGAAAEAAVGAEVLGRKGLMPRASYWPGIARDGQEQRGERHYPQMTARKRKKGERSQGG